MFRSLGRRFRVNEGGSRRGLFVLEVGAAVRDRVVYECEDDEGGRGRTRKTKDEDGEKI